MISFSFFYSFETQRVTMVKRRNKKPSSTGTKKIGNPEKEVCKYMTNTDSIVFGQKGFTKNIL